MVVHYINGAFSETVYIVIKIGTFNVNTNHCAHFQV